MSLKVIYFKFWQAFLDQLGTQLALPPPLLNRVLPNHEQPRVVIRHFIEDRITGPYLTILNYNVFKPPVTHCTLLHMLPVCQYSRLPYPKHSLIVGLSLKDGDRTAANS